VREAIFDVLGSLGAIEGARVCDLFAGSGALGIEALSRGASAVVFVESDRVALKTLQANIASAGFGDHRGVRLVRQDAFAFLASEPEGFEVLLADPPYAFEEWQRLLGFVERGLVVAEHRRPLELPPHLVEHRSYRYGTTLVTVARAQGGPHAQVGREKRLSGTGEAKDDDA
jgi:16S rRNA (guanine966-N2)-methyltransferase